MEGNLGILLPTYARSYLVVAYRYLDGKPLSASEAEQANKLIQTRLSPTDAACDSDSSDWDRAREAVASVPAASAITPGKSLEKYSYITICNCQTPAFRKAAETLKALIASYGVNDQRVKDWVAAQDAVFSNCGGGKKIPDKLPATADKLMQQNREYQIASAHFYSGDYDAARQLYLDIARQPDNPWAHISHYLAERALVRKGTTETEKPFEPALLKQADQELLALIANPAYADMKSDLVQLDSFVGDRIAPARRLNELSTAVEHGLTEANLDEYTDVYDFMMGDSDSSDDAEKKKAIPVSGLDEMSDWIQTFQGDSSEHALKMWEKTKKPLWLIAAMSGDSAKPSDTLLKAAESIAPSDRAYDTISYEVARALMRAHKFDEARKRLDQALAQQSLDLSSRNRLLTLRIQLAQSLPEFLKLSQTHMVGVWGGGIDEIPWDDPDAAKKPPKLSLLPKSVNLLDFNFPVSVLNQASQSNALTQELRNAIAKSLFVRAVLLDNESTAKLVATRLKGDPKFGRFYATYATAPTPAERKFAAAFLMLHDDYSDPTVGGDLVSGEKWWWSTIKDESSGEPGYGMDTADNPALITEPPFLTTEQIAEGKKEVAALAKVPSATTYLPRIAIDWAKSHPGDIRVPEALHFAVRTTHYGDRDATSSALSKEAFTILHHKYPKSPWTAKTPYYY